MFVQTNKEEQKVANLNLYIKEIKESVSHKLTQSIEPYMVLEQSKLTNLYVTLYIENFEIDQSKLQSKTTICKIPGYLPLTPLTFELIIRLYTSELIEDFELSIINKETQEIDFYLQGRALLSNLNSISKVEMDFLNRPVINTVLNIRWCDECGRFLTNSDVTTCLNNCS